MTIGCTAHRVPLLYELKADRPFGLQDNFVTHAKNFGDGIAETYNGVDVNLNARVRGGDHSRARPPHVRGRQVTNVNVVEPGGNTRTNVGVDIFNTSAAYQYLQTYNAATPATWLQPSGLVAARFVKLSVQFDFRQFTVQGSRFTVVRATCWLL